MGQAAYLGVGAYAAATLNIFCSASIFFWRSSSASLTAAAVGAITLVPLLRIGGFYFSLATLGMNFVFFDIFHNLAPRVEGSEGLYGLQLPDLLASSRARFATTLRSPSLCVLLCQSVVTSPLGRALRATRDRPDASRRWARIRADISSRLDIRRRRLTGLAGGLYAATLFSSIRRCSR